MVKPIHGSTPLFTPTPSSFVIVPPTNASAIVSYATNESLTESPLEHVETSDCYTWIFNVGATITSYITDIFLNVFNSFYNLIASSIPFSRQPPLVELSTENPVELPPARNELDSILSPKTPITIQQSLENQNLTNYAKDIVRFQYNFVSSGVMDNTTLRCLFYDLPQDIQKSGIKYILSQSSDNQHLTPGSSEEQDAVERYLRSSINSHFDNLCCHFRQVCPTSEQYVVLLPFERKFANAIINLDDPKNFYNLGKQNNLNPADLGRLLLGAFDRTPYILQSAILNYHYVRYYNGKEDYPAFREDLLTNPDLRSVEIANFLQAWIKEKDEQVAQFLELEIPFEM
jgi:hypothetical protein